MKKIILALLCILPITLMAQQNFTIKGNVKTLKGGDKIYLVYSYEGQRKTDSAIVVGSAFGFKGNIKGTVEAKLYKNRTPYMKGGKNTEADFATIYIEPGNINITSKEGLSVATVTGTPSNEENNKLKAALKLSQDKQRLLGQEFEKLTPEQQKNKATMAALEEKMNKAWNEMFATYFDFVKKNPDSFVGLKELTFLSGIPGMEARVDSSFQFVSARLKATPMGKTLAEQLNRAKKSAIGIVATDFTQNNPEGKPIKLSDFKGKYVLVDFWASWCHPCREENPIVLAAYNKFKQRNFTVLGISLDGGSTSTKEDWLKAIKEDGMPWTQVSDLKGGANEAAQIYGVKGIPFNFLIDPQGKIVARNLRGAALEMKLEELIGQKSR